jgi:aminomethyltransferase
MTPVEADLAFAISPSRIKDGNFRGANKILNEIENGSQFVRVGLLPEGRRPVRKGTPIFNNDEKIGEISSGGYGPTIKSPIAMGIIKSEFNKPNRKLSAKLGENSIPMTITSLPFVEHRYFKKGNKQ